MFGAVCALLLCLSLTAVSAAQESTLREEARTHAWENERLKAQVASLEARVSGAEERSHTAAQVATAEVERAHEATRAEAKRCADAETRYLTAQSALEARTKEAAQSALLAKQAATDAAAAAATHARQLAASRRAAEDTEASAAAATRAAEAALQAERHKAASSAAAEADARAAAQRATARCEALQQSLAEAQREAAEARKAAANHEAMAAEVPSLQAAVQDLQAQVAALRAEAASRSKELAAARQAAVSTAQVAVLQERLRDAEAKAKRAEAAAGELATARASSPQQQRQQTGSLEATASAAEMASIRQQLAAAVAAKGASAAEVARLTTALAYCESQLSDTQLSLAAAQAEAASARSSLLRSENHVQLLQEERDALQRFLKAYDDEDEATRGTGGAPGTPAAAPAAGGDALARQRAVRDAREAELGAALSRAHGRLAELEGECNRLQAAADAATKQAGGSAKKAAAAEKEAAALAREVAALQQRLGAGEFDATKLRVLHMRANPEQAARTEAMRAQIERLQRDNGDLQARVDALMAGAASAQATAGSTQQPVGGGGGPDPVAVAIAECTVLRRRVADLEKRETRYKAVFAESIATVRDAVRCIFGYTLELELPGDKVTVRSSLSGDECHVLCFKVARGDAAHGVDPSAELLPGAWSGRPDMKRSVETFVTRCRSVPALTANLTLELFNAMTMA